MLFIFSLHGLKKAALVLSDSWTKKYEKNWKHVWKVTQILEETRIQDLVQFTGRKQNPKDNESNIHKSIISIETYFSL